jgi:hypothetical protein
MKCVYCLNDSKYPERADGKCPKCGKRFAFEPKTGAIFTDMAFKSAIDAVSSLGTVRFLPQHVYYELARRKRGTRSPSVVFLVLSGICLLVALASPFLLIPAAVLGLIAALLWPKNHLLEPASSFDSTWSRWISIHGAPPGLIVRKLPGKDPAPSQRAADIQQYSFDRAVICDRPETVDVLLANNFHFENNCAVLAKNGYPPRAFDTVKEMLQKNPRLTVYVLHDATVEGCTLAHELATSKSWFRDRARVVEVGIRPAHAKSFRGVWLRGDVAIGRAPGITAREASWLAQSSLELFAIRPEQIIKRLFKAIATDVDGLSPASQFLLDDGPTFWVDAGSFSSDASASDGGGDSFG